MVYAQNRSPLTAVDRVIHPNETAQRWRAFWDEKEKGLAALGLLADRGDTVVMLYSTTGVLLTAFTFTDTPTDINAKIVELSARRLS